MKEYISCGVRLGWLINPDARQVEIYRQGEQYPACKRRGLRSLRQNKEILDNPQTLSGENVMPNLVVDLAEIFD